MLTATHDMASETGEHVVYFYDNDVQLSAVVGRYIASAIAKDEVAVVIATADHRVSIEDSLARSDVDVGAARTRGQLVMPDAGEAISQFVHDGAVDPEGFRTVIGAAVADAAARGRPVRAFGEMVAMLWAAGNVIGAIELERLWNDLAADVPFSLLCAYPRHSVSTPEHATPLREVCQLHTAVFPVDPEPVEASCQFEADLKAPSAARRFVVDVLQRWGHGALVDTAAVIVAELTTNAVIHTRSPFTVAIRGDEGGLRVGVRDASEVWPAHRNSGLWAESGRGLDLVAALADRWGVEASGNGKEVWAELGGFGRRRRASGPLVGDSDPGAAVDSGVG